MTDYWINPKQQAVGVVAISDREMLMLYQVKPAEKEHFRQMMTSGLPLRQARVGAGELLSLMDLTAVSLSPMSRCLHLQFVEGGQKGQHYLYLWDRVVYDRVVETLQDRLGSGWEHRKGTADVAQTWKNSWPIWLLVLLFTVIGFFAVRQWETGEAEQFRGGKGAAGRVFAEGVGRAIGSVGCLLSGLGLMALYALWLIYRTVVPNQEQLIPVEEEEDDSRRRRRESRKLTRFAEGWRTFLPLAA